MRRYLARHISMCLPCLTSKKISGRQKGELHPIPPGLRPFATIHADHVGPFPTTRRGNKYVLVIIDNLTKYVQLHAVKDTSAAITVKKLGILINQFGAPGRIVSDRGTAFTAKSFESFCEEQGIRHTLNSARHPQANGLVERVNRTLIPAMITAVNGENQHDWDQHIKNIEWDFNSSINKTTGEAPFVTLLGYLPRKNSGGLRFLTTDGEVYEPPKEVQEKVRQRIEEEQRKYKERYDQHRVQGCKYELGDLVYMKTNPISTGESTKLQSRFKGPYVIEGKLPADTYLLRHLTSNRKNVCRTTASVSQLKIWRGGNCSEEPEDDSEEFTKDDKEPEPQQGDEKEATSGEEDLEEAKQVETAERDNRPRRTRKPVHHYQA